MLTSAPSLILSLIVSSTFLSTVNAFFDNQGFMFKRAQHAEIPHADSIKVRQVLSPRQAAVNWEHRFDATRIEKRGRTSPCPTKPPNCPNPVQLYGQCGGVDGKGESWTSCCVPKSYCKFQNQWYSQCVPEEPSKTTTTTARTTTTTVRTTTTTTTTARITTTTTTARTTTTTTQPSKPTCPVKTSTCKPGSGSDGETPYTVSAYGVTYPRGVKAEANGHINYQAISCKDYTYGQTYKNKPRTWQSQSFNIHFDPNNNQPNGRFINQEYVSFDAVAKAFPNGYCITWVQVSKYNQHYGEGGQYPVCSDNCKVVCV